MRIGVLIGHDDTFCRALTDRIGELSGDAATAAPVSLGAWPAEQAPAWDAVLDRTSHEVAFYRSVLRAMSLSGVSVINDPFTLDALDRFTALERCRAAGLAVPRTLLLPQKEYPPSVAPGALRGLTYPQPWSDYIANIGGSGRLKPVAARSFLSEMPVTSEEELLQAFDRTGCELAMLQENVPWDIYVRCLVIGAERVIVCRYDPVYKQYLNDPGCLESALETEVVRVSTEVSQLLGLDLNAVDFAVEAGRVSLIEPFNPLPELEISALTPFYFEKAVQEIAELCLKRAASGKPAVEDRRDAQAKREEVRLKAHVPSAGNARRQGADGARQRKPKVAVTRRHTRELVQKTVRRKGLLLKASGRKALRRRGGARAEE